MSQSRESNSPDVLTEAIEHHQNGRIQEALAGYARVLEANPDEPTALNFLGMLHVQFGDPKIGAQLIKRATEVAPQYAGAHCNLGNALVELGEAADARVSYENALAVDASHAESHNNLGVLLRYASDVPGAIAHLLVATEIRPDWATAHLNLGNAFAHSGNHTKAIDAYTRAVEANPRLNDAYRMLGQAFYARGELERAATIFRRLLEIDPQNPIAPHMLAAVTGESAPERCTEAYVASTFDSFAASFDRKLAGLGYEGPGLVVEAVARHLDGPDGSLRCLDLGAGTGLCGPIVKPYARELVGVDLSPEMLKKASRREVYDELRVADLCTYLADDVGTFDLMISADVLIYFGVLDELFEDVSRRLAPGGYLAFTVEACASDEPPGYELLPSGRYAHSRAYLEEQLAASGLEVVSIEEATLRKELGQPVVGWLVVARKPGGEG